MKAFLYRACAIIFSHFVLYPDYRISFFIPLAFRFADYKKEESVPTDVTKAEKQEQVQVEAEDEDTLENGEQVFRVVEVMPKFPGGDAELLKFIAKNVKYPQESQNKGEQGRVICSFVVTKDGTLTNYKVIRGISPALDQEAVRVLQMMPRWTPGTQRGEPVAVKYTVPITFKLQ